MRERNNQKGEVVVEATIVVSIVVIFISVLFYIGMLLYQQALLTTAANNAASAIAQTYSNELRDSFTGYIDAENIYQSVTYQSMKSDAALTVMEQKANAMTLYRIKSSSILKPTPKVDVQIVTKEKELLKSQIVVTVTDTYTVPLVGFFGVNNKVNFSAEGRADCVDILEYIYGVEAIGDPEGSPIQSIDEQNFVVVFIPDRDTGKVTHTVPVLAGHSIISSNGYTHSTMPGTPVNGDFEFAGWVDQNGRAFTAQTVVSSDLTVYGVWKCTVTFDPCGNASYPASVSPTSMKVERHKTAKLPTPKRKGNYTFMGWFTQPEGKGIAYYSETTPIENNVTLYAFWRCDHDWQLTESIVGTCTTRGKITYTCKQCGAKKETPGDYGSHSMQWNRYDGVFCYDKCEVYKCSLCGMEQRNGPIHNRDMGEHSFSARCNEAHYFPNGFLCTTAAKPDGSLGRCGSSTGYHSTCIYCGKVNAYWSGTYGTKTFKQVYWCGRHYNKSIPVTGCGYGGTIF